MTTAKNQVSQSNKVTLAEMADRLNEQFGQYLEQPIHPRSPYDWWKRTKAENISEPLPHPVMLIGRTPVWRWPDIVAWFIRYKGVGKLVVNVKPGVVVGDEGVIADD